MDAVKQWPVQVFYDGACPLCSREMGHYRKLDVNKRVEWVDVAGAGFDAGAYGLDPVKLQQMMHVKMADGRVFTQVRAFVRIWEALPRAGVDGVFAGAFEGAGDDGVGGGVLLIVCAEPVSVDGAVYAGELCVAGEGYALAGGGFMGAEVEEGADTADDADGDDDSSGGHVGGGVGVVVGFVHEFWEEEM